MCLSKNIHRDFLLCTVPQTFRVVNSLMVLDAKNGVPSGVRVTERERIYKGMSIESGNLKHRNWIWVFYYTNKGSVTVVFYCHKNIFYLKSSNICFLLVISTIWQGKKTGFEAMPIKWINQSRQTGRDFPDA